MRHEEGVTLVELLLAVTLMAVVTMPLIGAVYFMLTIHQEVVSHNELQHQGRFIMEYISTKVREGATWDEEQNKLLMVGEHGEASTLLWYDGQRILFGEEGAYVASEYVEQFTVQVEAVSPDERQLHIHLKLFHPQTRDRFQLSNRMTERKIIIDYSSP